MDTPTLAQGLTNVSTAWDSVATMIAGNIWLLTFLGVGLIKSGFKLFKRARKAVGA